MWAELHTAVYRISTDAGVAIGAIKGHLKPLYKSLIEGEKRRTSVLLTYAVYNLVLYTYLNDMQKLLI